MKRLLIALAALAATTAGAQSTQSQFGEKVDVNLVLVDAVVTDSHGNQMLGLTKDDFVVKENGVPQTIDSVEYFTNRTLLDSKESNAPFNVQKVTEPRYYVFFFDKPQDAQLWSNVATARAAAQKFVDAMRPGDQVAVAGHDVRLKIYSDFTADKAVLRHALEEAGAFGNGITSGSGPILSAVDKKRLLGETGTVYEGLEVLGDALRPIRGRKNLILFSAGILEPGQSVRGGMVLSESIYYKPMIQSLNASNVSVYAMNLLRDETPMAPMFHQTLQEITHDTNGDYYRTSVNFEPVLRRVEQATSGYYLITYYAKHPKGARGFQKIDVTVRSPEFRVAARAGYRYGTD